MNRSPWASASNLGTSRFGATATLLPSGKVLVAGGNYAAFPSSLAGAEIYDPAGNTWTNTAPLAAPRAEHTATLLHDGTVLVVGGWDSQGRGRARLRGALRPAGRVMDDRGIPLRGKVGSHGDSAFQWTGARPGRRGQLRQLDRGCGTLRSGIQDMERHGPAQHRACSAYGHAPRRRQGADFGRVQLQGSRGDVRGVRRPGTGRDLHRIPESCEGRAHGHAARERRGAGRRRPGRGRQPAFVRRALRSGGRDLDGFRGIAAGPQERRRQRYAAPERLWSRIEGGIDANFPTSNSEVYVPENDAWTSMESLPGATIDHTTTLLANGKVLVAGGSDDSGNPESEVALFDPEIPAATAGASLAAARAYATSTLLANGKVLVAGAWTTAPWHPPSSMIRRPTRGARRAA